MDYTKLSRIIKVLVVVLLIAASMADADMTAIVQPIKDALCGLYCVIFGVAGFIASLVFLLAGLKWIGSADDPSGRKQAKDTMIFVVVGLIIIAIANNIVGTILDAGDICTC